MQTDTRAIRMILAETFGGNHDDEKIKICANRILNSLKQSPAAPMPLDWKILTGQPVTEDDLLDTQARDTALKAFEAAFGFGKLPWSSNTDWERFEKFVVRIYKKDPDVFMDYVKWRTDKGKYTAMSNLKIRNFPGQFMDTGYPEFEASKMYEKPETNRPKARVVS